MIKNGVIALQFMDFGGREKNLSSPQKNPFLGKWLKYTEFTGTRSHGWAAFTPRLISLVRSMAHFFYVLLRQFGALIPGKMGVS